MDKQFDPMTGELLNKEPETTNEAVVETAAAEAPEVTPVAAPVQEAPAMNYNSAAGNVAKKKKGKALPVIIVLAVLVVAVVAGVVAVASGAFMSPSNKVLAAMANTFKEQSNLVKDLAPMDALTSGEYTVSIEAEVPDTALMFKYAMKDSVKQFSGSVQTTDIPEIEFLAELNDSELKVGLADLYDGVFTYNYVDEKTGYIAEMATEGELDMIDFLLEYLYAYDEKQAALQKEYSAAFLEFYKGLEFEKVDKEEYEVDGKDRDCVGYATTIEEDQWMELIDALEEATLNEMEDYEAFMEEYSDEYGYGYGESFADLFEDMRDDLEGIPDLDVTFYIYKNKIACIHAEGDGDELEILFPGSEKGMHNIEVVVDGDTVMELIGSVDGSEESYELEVEGETMMVLVYDYKSGDLSLEFGDEYEYYVLEGSLEASEKAVTMQFDEITCNDYTEEFTLSLGFESTATLEELDGDEFDLGEASEDELYELIMDINSAMSY